MKSSIKIDFDENGQPIIKVDIVKTEDVRDKLLQRFVEKLGYQSSYCKIDFLHGSTLEHEKENTIKTFIITPVTPDKLGEHGQLMIDLAKDVPK